MLSQQLMFGWQDQNQAALMAELERERSSSPAPSTSTLACEHEWELEEHGAQSVEVCVKCGCCKDHVSFEVETGLSIDCTTGSTYVSADGSLSGQGNSRIPASPKKRRELRFIRFVREAANTMHLNRTSINACIAEAKDLLKTNDNISQGMKKFAAGIVYLEMKKNSANVTFQSVSDQLGIKKKILGGIVKKLTARATRLERETAPRTVPFTSRLDDILEKLDLSLSQDERHRVKKVAQDLREICVDVPSKSTNYLLVDTEALNYGYFAVALQVVDPSQDEKEVVTMISEKTALHYPTVKHKAYQIRCRLLTVSKRIHSLEHIKNLNIRGILRYIPTILRNKTFLLKGPDRFNYITDAPTLEQLTPLPPCPSPWQRGEEGGEDTLSDLDSDECEEYIASEGEVLEKRRSMVQESS